MANHQPTALPIPRTPARRPDPAAAHAVAIALRADLEDVDYDALSQWDVVELIGRTIAVLDDLTDGGR